jgi:tetratricopeptide (TPR) repeat protein
METCELNILSTYLKKWSYNDNRINLSFSFFTELGYGRSAVDIRINNIQNMINEFLNNVVYKTKEYLSNIDSEYANVSIRIMSDSAVKGKLQGYFTKMVKEYNNNKRSHGRSRMISNRSMDFFYNDFEYESLDDASKFFVHLNRGVNKINGDLWKTAIEELQRALEFKPDDAVVNKYMAYAYTKMEKFDEAIVYYEKYVEANRSIASLNDLAKAYTLAQKYEKAKKTYKEMKKADPNDLLAIVGEAQVSYMQGKPYLEILDKIYASNEEWLRSYLKDMWEFKIPEFAENEENKWNAATASRFLGYERPFDLTKKAFNGEIPCYFDSEKGTIRFVRTELENWVEVFNRYNINGQHHEIHKDRLTDKELSIGIFKPKPASKTKAKPKSKPKPAKKSPAKKKKEAS